MKGRIIEDELNCKELLRASGGKCSYLLVLFQGTQTAPAEIRFHFLFPSFSSPTAQDTSGLLVVDGRESPFIRRRCKLNNNSTLKPNTVELLCPFNSSIRFQRKITSEYLT